MRPLATNSSLGRKTLWGPIYTVLLTNSTPPACRGSSRSPRTWRCLVSIPTTPFNSIPFPQPAPVTTRMRDPSNSGLGRLWRLAVTELGSVYTAVPAIADKRTHAFVRVRECKFSSSAESPSDSLIPRSLSSKKQLVKKGEKISKTSGICFLSQQIDLRLTRQIF